MRRGGVPLARPSADASVANNKISDLLHLSEIKPWQIPGICLVVSGNSDDGWVFWCQEGQIARFPPPAFQLGMIFAFKTFDQDEIARGETREHFGQAGLLCALQFMNDRPAVFGDDRHLTFPADIRIPFAPKAISGLPTVFLIKAAAALSPVAFGKRS